MKFKSKIPADVDPTELADRMKRSMTKKFLKDLDDIRKFKSHQAK